jgi:adenine specific DNA methylase Mod
MIYPKLQLIKSLMHPEGQVLIHCDYRLAASLRLLGDEIFGSQRFRNELIWTYSGGATPKMDWPRKHDTILRWALGDTWTFNVEY